MTSAIDDDDLALSISSSQPRRGNEAPNGTTTGPSTAASGSTNPTIPAMPPPRQRTGKGSERLGQYNIVKTLGEGSFGKVKLATHNSSGQKVALKIISRKKLVTRDMAGRIEREIQYLQLLRHPHIIKLYTVITMPTEIVMVLEYAGGELFDYIVKNGKMAEDKARKFFQQITCAVEYCHRHKIVHRDLKPENLLLDEQLNVKIADFGLSNIMTDGNFLKTSCGSPNYAAPEVISGKLYAGPEVDVWSCGVILYVLLCGRLPFDDEYIPSLFRKIAQGNYSIPPYVSSGAQRLIKKMLQVNPVNRITIQEIRQDPWFMKDLPEYLQPPVEDFIDTGVDPNKAIDPHALAKGKPVVVQEKLHQSVVGKLGKTMGYAPDDVQEALAKDEPSAIKDAYLIVRENQLMKTNPSLAQDQPAFMAQSPPTFNHSLPTSPPGGRPGPSPLAGMDHPRHGSTGSSSIVEARSPASTIAVLPSSLPDYHAQYMKGQAQQHASSPTQADDAPDDNRLRTQEEQEATARRLKPHSRSTTNLQRNGNKPESMTPIPDKGSKKTKPQKWQFGIRSRNTPCEAMLALYKALKKMGAEWEVVRPRDPGTGSGEGSPERGQRDGSQSPEYSDSDPEPGTDPEYATHSDQEKRRLHRRDETNLNNDHKKPWMQRYGRWNDWGYTLPEDPWVIYARFRKDNMYPPGINPPSSTHSSRVDLHEREARRSSSVSGANSTAGSMENMAAVGPGATSTSSAAPSLHGPGENPGWARAHDSAWVYVTIQLYSIEKDFYLVDFKCAGYERLVRRFASEVSGGGAGSNESDVVRVDNAEPGYEEGDGAVDEWGEEMVGAGRSEGEKDVSSPFPFLDVARGAEKEEEFDKEEDAREKEIIGRLIEQIKGVEGRDGGKEDGEEERRKRKKAKKEKKVKEGKKLAEERRLAHEEMVKRERKAAAKKAVAVEVNEVEDGEDGEERGEWKEDLTDAQRAVFGSGVFVMEHEE
ncbi:Protein kinase [Saxophila tyrrhenica]|uniref:non-specific serine/threonine protein kinase n=1 Tax=Saxophila tyrrhenica TaxID=1690608 RepID=A0AAV9NXV9_9PEZI|nr:Protein kinase [Saxophila tyrrhenica]